MHVILVYQFLAMELIIGLSRQKQTKTRKLKKKHSLKSKINFD